MGTDILLITCLKLTNFGVSSAIVFFDLKAAFYSVLRQALLAVELDPTALIAALARLGLPSALIDAWLQQARQDHAVLDTNPHLEELLQDCMTHTFFTVDGVPGLCHTTRGTRPGDPLGDLLFNLIMRLVLHDMHASIQRTCSAVWLGSPGSVSTFASGNNDLPDSAYLDVSFVDDVAVAVHAPSLPEVEHLIKSVVPGFHGAAASRGLDVNFGEGKTEVLWHITGRGSGSFKEKLHAAGQQLCWTSGDRPHLSAPLVSFWVPGCSSLVLITVRSFTDPLKPSKLGLFGSSILPKALCLCWICCKVHCLPGSEHFSVDVQCPHLDRHFGC